MTVRWWMTGFGPAMALLIVARCAPALAEDPPASLSGDAAWAKVVGNTASGTTPDGPYLEYFRTDGSLVIVDNDGKAEGHWALRADRLCSTVDGEEEECRTLSVTGGSGSFTDAAGGVYRFEILPGDPKGL